MTEHPGYKTYSYFAPQKRIPTDYEVVSTRLLFTPGPAYAILAPMQQWNEQYGPQVFFKMTDWESFKDPAATTYKTYIAKQHDQVVFLEGLLASQEFKAPPDPAFERLVSSTFSALRFPLHAMQMIAAYLGKMAPCSALTILCAMQAANEMKRVEYIARRLNADPQHNDALDTLGRAQWESGPKWQNLRMNIEQLLQTYDWGTGFVALNCALKPLFDGLVHGALARRFQDAGDHPTFLALESMGPDLDWHQEWTSAFLAAAVCQDTSAQSKIDSIANEWTQKINASLSEIL